MTARTAQLTASQLAEFERAVRRFEKDWLAGLRPEIESFLPLDGELRLVLLAELVQVDVEFRSKAGQKCHSAEYLAKFPELAGNQGMMSSLAAADGNSQSRAGQSEPQTRQAQPDLKQLEQRLVASRLVTQEQLRECEQTAAKDSGGNVSPADLAAELLRRGWVTRWQLEQLSRGQAAFFIDQDRYLILSLIGQGGMGSVYKARHVRMNRDVALKVIDPQRVTDTRLIDRFRREIEVCSKLQHEHVVQAFDVGEHAGATFLVLEFVEGADLASLVKRDGPMQPDEAAAICLQAAAGLAYAHGQGIVHRDIKPQNIMLSTAGVVRILDMGLARVLDDPASDPHTSLTQEGAVMGTVDYMAPEQARDTRAADGRSDIYSLGGTLYYLLAGQPPLAGGSMIEKMHRLANEVPPPLSQFRIDCPRELDAIVQKMLAKRPEDRFQSAGELIRALRPFAAERIAGRTAVTASVQSAADTLYAAGAASTDAAISSFITVDDSFETTKLRLQSQRGSPRKIAVGAAIATALIAAVAIWEFSAKDQKTGLIGDDKGPPPKTSTRRPPPRVVRELPGHFGGPTSMAWAPDGVHLAVGSLDGEVLLRVMGFAEPLVRYDKHRSSVVGVLWLPKSELIASTEAAGDIHIWHAFTGQTRHRVKRNRIDQLYSGVASSGGVGLACSADGQELSYSNGKSIIRLSIPAFEPLGSLPLDDQHPNWHDFRYSPSGKLLATSYYHGDSESVITITNLQTGRSVLRIKGLPAPPGGYAAEFLSGAFCGEDELAVMRPQRLEVWSVSAGKVVREFPIDTGALAFAADWALMAGFPAKAAHLALWTPEGLNLISTQDGASRRVTGPGPRGYQASGAGRHWDFTSDMIQVALFAANSPGLEVIRLGDGRRESPWGNEWFGMYTDSAGPPRVIGDVLLQYSPYQTWDLRTGDLRDDLAGKTFTISPAGDLWILEADRLRTLASAAGKSEDIATPILIEGLGPEHPQYRFWSGDRRRLFQHRDDGVHVWDTESGRKIAAFRPGRNDVALRYDGRTVGVVSDSERRDLIAEPYDQPPQIIQAGLPANSFFSLSAGNEYLAGPGVIYRTTDGKKFELENQALTAGWNGSFSRTGEYLLVDHGIWRLSGNAPEKIWTCPEETRAVHSLPNVSSFFANCWFDDEEHVALMQDASIGIWRWRENRKRATLYFLPEENWAFVNHETQHWNGSPGADRYLRYERPEGDDTLRLKPAEDRKRFRWKNDPEKAGLDLRKR